jgi:hypothetical protein
MKTWNGYGSEHSMNLVMIGYFKNIDDAEKTQKVINRLSERLIGKVDFGDLRDHFPSDVLDILREEECYSLSPNELEQFLCEANTRVEGDKIILTTDESDVSAFFKLMVMKGARVEIFSAHDYPDAEYGRGK